MHGIIAGEEQAPLDLFLVSIETRSFIFTGMDIRPIDPPSPSACFSSACSPCAAILIRIRDARTRGIGC